MKTIVPELLSILVFLATTAVVAQDSCQLCPEGSTMGDPDRPIYEIEEFSSCGEIDDLVLAPLPQASCVDALDILLSGPLDFREYCGCSDYVGPAICTLCAEDEILVNEDVEQEMLGGYTCNQIADLADSAKDDTTCGTFAEATPFCCSNPSLTNSTGSNDANSTETCELCEDGAQIQNPDRELFLLDDISCNDFSVALTRFATYPFCDIFPFFDTQAYCGCEGSSAPTGCEFCEVTTPDTEVYIVAINMTLSCSEVELLATYATDNDLCSVFGPLESVCCSSSGSQVPGASSPPEEQPTTPPSTSATLPTASGTSVLFTICTLITTWRLLR